MIQAKSCDKVDLIKDTTNNKLWCDLKKGQQKSDNRTKRQMSMKTAKTFKV